MANEPENENAHNAWAGFLSTAALIAVMLISTVLAAQFLLSPMLEKQSMLNRQAELLESIEYGDGVLVSDQLTVDSLDSDWYFPVPDGVDYDMYQFSTDSEQHPEANNFQLPADNYQLIGIGILTIEKIDLTLPVTDGVSETQLKIAVGHVPQTAPIGETGNAVIAGHRSYTYGQYFNRLGELEVGDIIKYRSIEGESMEFEVYEILEVLPGDPVAFDQPDDKQVLTLYTCTPIRTATHRLLVRAERIL